MTDFIRVKHKITGIVADIPAHYAANRTLFEPWEFTDDEDYCVDCEIPAPEVPIEVAPDPVERPVPSPRKASK